MHSKAYTTRDTIRIIPAYGEGAIDYPKPSRVAVRQAVREAVTDMLHEEAKSDRRVWWARRPFAVSVRAGYGRGEWAWCADPAD